MTQSKRKPPWKRRTTARHHAKLSAADKAVARARARRAGRRYPNLIDNMYVARRKNAGARG